jgi:DNA helicase MCM8
MSATLPPELTQVQKQDLLRIWATQNRPLVDVRPTIPLNEKIEDHTLRFICRLHAFFRALLKYNLSLQNDVSGDCESGEDRPQQQPANQFVKNCADSCLGSFLNMVLMDGQKLNLLEGRTVVSVHHEDFLSEVHHFELKGEKPSEDFVKRHSFGAFLYHRPQEALAAMASAIGLAMATLARRSSPQVDRFLDTCQWVIRFLHVRPQVRMMDVKTGMAYKFLTVKGHVVKARPKRLRVVTADFTCPKCGGVVTHSFDKGQYSTPNKCSTSKCRTKHFILNRTTARYINIQELRLQESQEESTAQAGRTPRQMEVELTHDLVDSCRPGDIVMVASIVQAVNSAIAAGRTGKRAQETSTYKLYLEGHSITTLSERRDQTKHQQQGVIVYTQQQLQRITQLCHADHRYFGMMERMAFPFDLLVRSLCPSIIGHDMVKAGILLCLLGGTPAAATGHGNSIRSNSHLLICGDPGMGKSQMLLAATQVAARSVYVGGNTASTTGLTVSMTKEAGGEAGIEAGALVLADQGICCIDEFDKMAKSHQDGLLEAMEQQQISIAKAGVVASLPARCSIIAAANPKHGSYNLGKTVAENLNMATPILSRFDLVFILRDRADKAQDRLVASNIMNHHRGTTHQFEKNDPKHAGDNPVSSAQQQSENRMPMKDRLEWVAQFQKQPLPAELVRDYISYAREYCKPVLTKEAAEILKEYFMNLRYPTDGRNRRDTVPITTRQLEALIRLSQARAKACLREYVLREDALDVIELMSRSVDEIHTDEFGTIDRSRGGAGGVSNRKIKKAFVNELYRLIGAGAECSMDDLRRIAGKLNCPLHDFATMIENLRNEGVLMKNANGTYQVMSI